MSNTISIRHNFPEVARKLELLADDIGNKALVRALNTTIDQGRTQMAREISQEFRITVGKAKGRLEIQRASAKAGNLRFEAVLRATSKGKGRSMNLFGFVTSGPRRTRKGLSQIKFQIKRSGGRKEIKGAFLGNQGRTVFIRTGKERLPIKALSTIDIPQMFNTRTLNAAVRKVMLTRFDANFKRELRTVLGGWSK